MTSNWNECKLDEIIIINPTETLRKGDVAKKVAMEKLLPFCRDIPNYEFQEYNGGTKFRNGDTIMARITPCLENGKISQVRILDNNEIGFGSTEYIIFRAKEGITNSDFIYYLVTSSIIREPAIKSMVGSSGRQRVQTDVVKQIEVKLPPLDMQQKIAKVLSVIDDKIELNNSINNNLEQQAQAIFKSWFVDFEPFGGTMPGDWKILKLENVCNISAGGDKPKEVSKIRTDKYSIPVYSNGIDNEGLYGYTIESKIVKESVTISARGTIGYTCLRLEPYVPIVRLIAVEPKDNKISAKYLYHAIKKMNIVGYGTTQQQITVPYCKMLNIIIPTQVYMDKFTTVANSIYKIIYENKKENLCLTQLRETLLPKLMNGEIDVDKVEV